MGAVQQSEGSSDIFGQLVKQMGGKIVPQSNTVKGKVKESEKRKK